MREQLCWSCRKTNAKECPWMEYNSVLPDFVTLDKNGFIVECKNFEIDRVIPSDDEICKKLKIKKRELRGNRGFYIDKYYTKKLEEK